jgi:hypothetical protein
MKIKIGTQFKILDNDLPSQTLFTGTPAVYVPTGSLDGTDGKGVSEALKLKEPFNYSSWRCFNH